MKWYNLFFIGLSFIFCVNSAAQELNATVTVDSRQTGRPNLQIFKTLKKSVEEFINKAEWTDQSFEEHERIECSFFIIVNAYEAKEFSASLQVQASRPVFDSSYTSTLLNIKDKNFSFSYTEFEPLNYNPNSFDTNLVSVVSYYIYTILGLDADSFENLGGTTYYEEARKIVTSAQSSGRSGWESRGSNFTRGNLNQELLAQNFTDLRNAFYTYHRKGLDIMNDKKEDGKEVILQSISDIRKVDQQRPNSLLVRTFFDAKASEILNILNGGPKIDIAEIKNMLYKMAPVHSRKWERIRY
jgi:hypothetical protein